MTTRRRATRGLTVLVAGSLLHLALTAQTTSAAAPATSPAGLAAPASTLGVLPHFGETGAHVMRAQQALVAAGIDVVGGADGVFGVNTSAAIRRFQRSRGLEVTGTVDTSTARSLGLELPVQGDRGRDVTRLQRLLIDKGITPLGGADGIFGSGTAAAIARFQGRKDLSRTGVLDAATAIALRFAPQPDGATSPTTTSAPPTTVKQTTTTVKQTTTTVRPTTTTAPPTSGSSALRVGAQGPGVVRLQQALLTLSIPVPGGADGVFGNATRSAVITFQDKADLATTGVVDSAARRRLDLDLPEAGDRSGAVKRLQQRLLAAGITVRGGADGIFGSATSAAVETYQSRNGLPATGIVNEQTAVRLDFRPSPAALPGMPTTTTSPTTTTAPVTVRLGAFPVQGQCWYADTWMAPRSGGRLHEGVDIIAAEGKLVYAVSNGVITRQYFDQPGSLSGNGIRLTRSDGTYFFYAHFSRFAKGISMGSTVKAGQVVGYIGETGNAATPHLHFEVHPGGGDPVNPTPIVRAVDACSRTTPLGN